MFVCKNHLHQMRNNYAAIFHRRNNNRKIIYGNRVHEKGLDRLEHTAGIAYYLTRKGAGNMQIITAAIIKGGTGKTTTIAALAQAAAADGQEVLAIDLDPQGNLTVSLGAALNHPGSYDLLHGADPAQLIQQTAQGVDVISASADLALERTLPGSAMRLKEAIEPIKKKYQFIFIDTPPTIGETTYNALQASTCLIIPLETDSNALQGLYQIVDITNHMRQSNPKLSIIGAVLTRYDSRPKINRYLRDAIKEQGRENGVPLIAEIRPGIAIREAQALQRSIFEYAPRSKPAQDYNALYKFIAEKRKR